MNWKLLLIAGLFSVLARAAQADYVSGNDLLAACDDTSETHLLKQTYCLGYIVGISDLMNAMKRTGQIKGYCAPDNAPAEQLMRVVDKFLKDHPEGLNTSASSNTFMALASAFPCAPQK